jgi:hypothetical protein
MHALMPRMAARRLQAESNQVTSFVTDNWLVIQQVVGPEYSYQPSSAYAGATQGALRVCAACWCPEAHSREQLAKGPPYSLGCNDPPCSRWLDVW